MTRAAAGWMIALACASAGAARADGETIVVPAEAATGKVDAAVLGAAARGVKQAAPSATVADASLADSAFILGCDPATDACRDEVAGQLGYERLVIVARRDSKVEVVVRQRGGASQRKTFVVTGEGDQAGLATVERDVAAMLGGVVALAVAAWWAVTGWRAVTAWRAAAGWRTVAVAGWTVAVACSVAGRSTTAVRRACRAAR